MIQDAVGMPVLPFWVKFNCRGPTKCIINFLYCFLNVIWGNLFDVKQLHIRISHLEVWLVPFVL